MANLYLTEQGSKIIKKGKRLIVKSPEGKERLEIECRHIETILLFGNIQFSTQACAQMLNHDIEMALLTQNGKLRGQLTPPRPRNIALRIRQYELQKKENQSTRLEITRQILQAKIQGALDLLQKDQKNHPNPLLKKALKKLLESQKAIQKAPEQKNLLGIEGNAASIYFDHLSLCCRGPLPMKGRTRRPPQDPMNSLLSFGYTLLAQEITSLLDAIGLDPYIGLFHARAHGRPALALDLLEEFRHPCVDRFALNLNNRKELLLEDFQEKNNWRLERPALQKFLAKWDKWMTENKTIGPGENSRRKTLRQQAERLARTIRSETPYRSHYLPEEETPF